MSRVLDWLLDVSPFPPRWSCGDWTPLEGWTHIVSDLVIWGAYTCIPIALAVFLRTRPNWPLRPLLGLFVAFILLCGTTHLIEALVFWTPVYRLAGLAKVATAIASTVTVVVLVRNLPLALSLRSPQELEAVVEERTAQLEAARASAVAARDVAESARRTKEQFLTSFHAEARAPIEAIVRHADQLLQALEGTDELHRRAAAIVRHGRHQLELFDDVLEDGATSGAPVGAHPAWVSLRPLIEQALDIAARGRAFDSRRVTIQIAEDCAGQLWLDPLRLRQVVVNLLDAALEAAPRESGDGAAQRPVTVTAHWRDPASRRRWLRLTFEAPALALSEADIAALVHTGASDERGRRSLHTARLRTLAIARRAAETMAGELLVQRTPEGGCVLDVDLPVHETGGGARAGIAGAAGELEGLPGVVPLAVLVADVPSLLAERVVEDLQRIGAEVTLVHGGAEAAAALQWAAAIAHPFHVALVELDLPDDGFEHVLAALRTQGFTGLVIPMAGFARRAGAHRADASIGPEPMVKPITAAVLYRTLATRLRAAGGAPRGALDQLERHASLASEPTLRPLHS